MHNPILQRRRSSGLFKGHDGAPLNVNATKKRPERDGLPTPEKVSPVPVPVSLDRKSSFRNGDVHSTRGPGQTTPPVFVQRKRFSFVCETNLQEQSRENLFSKPNNRRSRGRHNRANRMADDLLADDNYKRFVVMTISMSLFIVVVISISLYQMISKNFT